MLVQNVGLSQNNYSKNSNPNFTSIRSVRCEGLYKKYPELANNLVETLKNNPKAMAFCKKYDVDIVFYAAKQMEDAVKSSIHIFFDNISKSKFRKFFDKLTGSSSDQVTIHAWGRDYPLARSIKTSTANLVEAISPERKVGNGYRGGLLDSHLQSADENIEKVLQEKLQKDIKAAKKVARAKADKSKLEYDTSSLQKSIEDLIDSGK